MGKLCQHLAGFVRSQLAKTVARPSRLLVGPLLRCVRTLLRFPMLTPYILPILPTGLIERAGRKTFFVEAGCTLFQNDYPVEAWPWFEQYLRLGRSSVDGFHWAGLCLYQGFGRFQDAMVLFTRANELAIAQAKKLGLAECDFRVLNNGWVLHIGHCATLDYVIKLGILEGRHRQDTILYLPPGSQVANRFLLEELAPHVRVVEHPNALPFPADVMDVLQFDLLAPRLPDGTTSYFWEVGGTTYKRWLDEGRAPLLSLSSETQTRGWAALHRAGIPEGAWFVALHVREGQANGRSGGGLNGIRNADITTYLPAVREITTRGGWVLRMGDPNMKPLPPMANVVDYCHSDLRADWMDVFIAARCRFMIGTSSGPAVIPALYGVPTILTNWWPPAQRPWHAFDTFVPKLPRRLSDGRYLTLTDSLREPLSYCHSRRYLADHEKVSIEDCDAEVLAGAVKEMLARSEGNRGCTAEVANLRARADQIYRARGVFGMGQLAAEFLRRHPEFIA